jgi:hypothetical protein
MTPNPGKEGPARAAGNQLLMKNPLDSLWGTVISGFIITAILWFIAKLIVSHTMGAGA